MMNWIGGITLIWRRCILIAWVSTHCQATSAIDCRAGAHATQRTVWRAFEGLVAKSEIAPKLAALSPAICWLPDAQELACYRADAPAGYRDADFYWVKSSDPRKRNTRSTITSRPRERWSSANWRRTPGSSSAAWPAINASAGIEAMAIPDYIDRRVLSVFPDSLTIIPTYRCNAQCEQCCFESNPRIRTRLSLDDIKRSIDAAVDGFENLKLIVFSGGEVFLLKEDLFEAVAYAAKKGLLTRCVTNAFWGRKPAHAQAVADRLQSCGVAEINISTGMDHQRWVPFASVEHAVEALVGKDIFTLVTVERDSETSDCFAQATQSDVFQAALRSKPLKFSLQCNSWMPFNDRYVQRGKPAGLAALTQGCSQIFHNLVVTPREELAVCCGLTFEHIDELKVGSLASRSMGDLFEDTFRDFLKIWIHMDGPGDILRKLFGEAINDELSGVHHICQACAILHQHPEVRRALQERYHEFVPDVIARFNLRIAFRQHEKALASGRGQS